MRIDKSDGSIKYENRRRTFKIENDLCDTCRGCRGRTRNNENRYARIILLSSSTRN